MPRDITVTIKEIRTFGIKPYTEEEMLSFAAKFTGIGDCNFRRLYESGLINLPTLRKYCCAQTLNLISSMDISMNEKYRIVESMFGVSYRTARQLYNRYPVLFKSADQICNEKTTY